MKYFSMMIKPASSLCNLRCSYCFYHDVSDHREIKSHGIMSDVVMNSLIERVFEAFQEESSLTFAFQGGEPTLAGLDYFRKFVDKVNHLKKDYHEVHYALQTNGTLLDDEWIAFLKENNFLVGISLDGFIKNHDMNRKDSQLKGTYERIMINIRKMKEIGVEFNILTVLTSSLSKHAKELYQFYKKNEFEYVQLIPCLPAFNNKKDPYALQPKQFFQFYDEFYQYWLKDYETGHLMHVTYLDNIIPLFAGFPPQQCGYLGFCSNQLIVESDGSVYPCDFYVLDQYYLGNIQEKGIKELALSNIARDFIQEERTYSKRCKLCRYKYICNGQCKRMSICYYDENYCGLEEFMTKHEKTIVEIARRIGK